MRIHEQIRARRLELGFTQSDMKARIGMGQQQYQRIESGGNANLATLRQITDGLNAELMLIPRDKVQTVLAVLSGKADVIEVLEDPWKELLGDLYEEESGQ